MDQELKQYLVEMETSLKEHMPELSTPPKKK